MRRNVEPTGESSSRRLIINADDFGFTQDVNAGIIEAYQLGILRSTTLMANGPAFDDAVRLAAENPGLDVGVHLALIGGESVSRPGRALPADLRHFLLSGGWRRRGAGEDGIQRELEAQIEKILAAGITPTHLDSHKHTHLLPVVLDAALELAARYEIGWIRRPFDLPTPAVAGRAALPRRMIRRGLEVFRAEFDRRVEATGQRTVDAFAGFQMTGDYGARELAALIESLPAGVTELMTHPGRCGPDLRAASTRLKQSREEELRALCAPEAQRAAERAGVEITNFAAL